MIIPVADSLPFDRLRAFIWSNLGGLKFDSRQKPLRRIAKCSEKKKKRSRIQGLWSREKNILGKYFDNGKSRKPPCSLLIKLGRVKTLKTHALRL